MKNHAPLMSKLRPEEIEAVCRKWYGKRWDDPDQEKRPGEAMKEVWRGYARKAVEAIDEVRYEPDNYS